MTRSQVFCKPQAPDQCVGQKPHFVWAGNGDRTPADTSGPGEQSCIAAMVAAASATGGHRTVRLALPWTAWPSPPSGSHRCPVMS